MAMRLKSKIFNTNQVRAIQDGRMTQFMQVVKPRPGEENDVLGGYTWRIKKGGMYVWEDTQSNLLDQLIKYCPFGRVGDVLYVKETTVRACIWDGGGEMPPLRYFYRADEDWKQTDWHDEKNDCVKAAPNWKSAVHMPIEAARLFLRITNIRMMRVDELKENDALAQAYGQLCECKIPVYPGACENCYNTGYNYPPLLDMKEKNGETWSNNPYMWVLDFTKTDKP